MDADSKEQIAKWLGRAPAVRGTLLRGVLFPDQSVVNDGADPDFPTSALEQAWRVASDTFQVLNAQRFPPTRLSWVYERAVLHCVQRKDGTLLGVFLTRKTAEADNDGLTRLLGEFQNLELARSTPPVEPN